MNIGIVYDEAQDLPESVFNKVDPMRTRAGQQGWMMVTGRPGVGTEGMNCWMHRLEQKFTDNVNAGSPDYAVYTFDATATMSDSELHDVFNHSGLAEDAIKREYFAEWAIDSNRAFYKFGAHNELIGQHTYNPVNPVGIGLDFNLNDVAMIVYQMFNMRVVHDACRNPNTVCGRVRPTMLIGEGSIGSHRKWWSGDQCPTCSRPLPALTCMAVLQTFQAEKGDTNTQCKWIVDWLRSNEHSGGVYLAGDATGFTGRATIDRFSSDWDLITDAIQSTGQRFKVYERTNNERTRHSVTRVNELFGDSEIRPACIYMDFAKCAPLTQELNLAERNWKGDLDKRGATLANAIDCLRYAAEEEFKLRSHRVTPFSVTPISLK